MKSSDANSTAPVLTRELRSIIFRFVVRRVRNEDAAEDITQQILSRAAAKYGSLRDETSLHGWIFAIARNAITDHIRRQKPTEPFEESLHSPDNPEPLPSETEEEQRLRERLAAYIRGVVDALPPKYREALLSVDYEGLSQADYARQAGISIPGAKSRVQRARALVRQQIEACCHFETDPYGKVMDYTPHNRAPCGENCENG